MKIIRFIVISFLSYLFISHLARVTPRQPSKQTASTRRTVGNRCFRVPGIWLMFVFAGLAQLVEQLICNQSVIGSSPIPSSRRYPLDVSKSHDTMLYTTSGGQHAAHKDSLLAASGGNTGIELPVANVFSLGSLAQSAEHRTVNPSVAGSNPVRPATRSIAKVAYQPHTLAVAGSSPVSAPIVHAMTLNRLFMSIGRT